MLSIFISHSSKDEALVDKLILLFRPALLLRTEEIRATSVVGYGLPGRLPNRRPTEIGGH